jgi:trimeric autotransporter adhesin
MTGKQMGKKNLVPFLLALFLAVYSCSELFQNGDLSILAETARGDITMADPLVTPAVFQKRVVTNLVLSVKATSAFEMASVEADLSALGGGTVNLVKSGDTWAVSLYIQSENAGALNVRFMAKSKTGKTVETNCQINVFTFGTVYVATNGNDTNDGLTATNAVLTVQRGVNIAAQKGIYEVLVSTGLYNQAVNGVCVNLAGALSVKGGYDLGFTARNLSATPSVIDGLGTATHVITAYAVRSVTLDGFIIRNGKASGDSGFEGSGAGILAFNSDIRLVSLVLSNHTATNIGGSLFAYNSVLELSNSVVRDSFSIRGGGIALVNCPSVAISDSLFTNNAATTYGGGLFDNRSSVSMSSNLFYHNISVSGGGAAYFESDAVSVNRCRFVDNRVTYSGNEQGGGGVMANASVFVLENSAFISNMAMNEENYNTIGGGLELYYCTNASVNACLFEYNTSTNRTIANYAGGGGIGTYYSINAVIQNSWIQRNYGYIGGGLDLFGQSTVTLTGNYIYSNRTINGQDRGGGVFINGSTVSMNNNFLSYNYAGYGSAIHLESATLNLVGGVISYNTNSAMYTNVCGFTMSGVTFVGNFPGDFY